MSIRPQRCSVLLTVALATGCALAQSVDRFHAYSVEMTQIDPTSASLFRFNNRGSFLGVDHANGSRSYLRYANGQRYDFPAGYFVDDLNNLDQVGGARNTTPLPNRTISRGWVFDQGVFTDILPASPRDPHLVHTGAYGLSDVGYAVSQDAYYDAQGFGRLCSPTLIGIGIASMGGVVLNPIQGTATATSAVPHGMWGGGDLGRINIFGNFVLEVQTPGSFQGFYRTHVSGVSVPIPMPAGSQPQYLDDRNRVVTSVGAARAWVHPDGRVETLGAELFATSRFPNLDGSLIGATSANPTAFHVGQPELLRLYGGSHVAVHSLVASWNGVQLLGSQFINDSGQILATVRLSTGEWRYAILHPGAVPMAVLEFRSPRGAGPRWDVMREPDGTVPFRIIGGQPGQPTAMFVRLGTQYHYVDGTLGLFDSRQIFEARLPVPASLVGFDFDVAAGALDSDVGILRSLDQPITFR